MSIDEAPPAVYLSEHHQTELLGSMIDAETIAARGYETLEDSEENRALLRDLKIPRWAWREESAWPGMLMPMYRVTGERISCQWKPITPQMRNPTDREPTKYTSPTGAMHIDVSPLMSGDVRDPSVPLWITEGIKKADCLASRGKAAIMLAGVYNWRSKEGTLGDWEDIPLRGRTVIICYDSDARSNRNVKNAMKRLGRWLESKGVQRTLYLVTPEEVDGIKVKGVDDFFAAGGTMDTLRDAATDALEDDTRDATFTDAVLAETACSEELDGRFKWAAGLGWMQWNGRVWKPATDVTVSEVVRLWTLEKFHRVLDEQSANSSRDMAAQIDGWRSTLSASRLGNIVKESRGILEASPEDFDHDRDLLNCPNGIVDLRTGVLLPADPDLLMTKITKAEYRAGARSEDWDKALEALPESVRDWFQLRVGQAMTGHVTPDDLVIICQGGGANGKSTIYDGIALAVGKYHLQVSDRAMLGGASDNHPTEMMDFMGARYAVLEETPEARRLDTNRLKKLAGTREITARRIRQDSVTFEATHSIFVNSNYRPVVDETDHGTWRRLGLLVYPYTFRRRQEDVRGPNDRLGDPTLRDRLKADQGAQEAILAWVVEGARRWYALRRIMPQLPDRVADDTLQWRKESDLILSYIGDHLEFDPDAHMIARELMEHFNSFLKERGQRDWGDKTFAARFGGHDLVAQAGVEKKKIKRRAGLSRPSSKTLTPGIAYYAWLGVRFKDENGETRLDQGGDPFDQDPVPSVPSENITLACVRDFPVNNSDGTDGTETESFRSEHDRIVIQETENDSDRSGGAHPAHRVPRVAAMPRAERPAGEVSVRPPVPGDGPGGGGVGGPDPVREVQVVIADPFADLVNPFEDPFTPPVAPPQVPQIDLSGPIGIDLETASADEAFTYGEGFVRLVGVIDQHDVTRTGLSPAELVDMIEAAPEVYGHNILGFDGPVLAHHHGMDWEAFAAKAVDTEPLARQAHPPRSRGKSSIDEYDLDHVAARYGLPGKTDQLPALAREHGGYDKIPEDDERYNAYLTGDLKATKAVREILPSDAYTRREHEILGLMGRMTINGFKVDVPLLRERQRQGEERKATALVSLSSGYGLPLGREVMRGRGKAKQPVTELFKSPLATTEGNAWLLDLWRQYGVTQPPRTNKGALSTAADELAAVAGHPKCPPELKTALDLMAIVTKTRTVYQTALTYLGPDGRVHPKVSMRQASGRGSVTQPGMTVYGKRDGKHVERDIFIADEGHVLIACDLSQVDMRAVAGHCQDPLYMALYAPGKDAHQEIADMMGVTRDEAKPLGHGYNYGMGAKAMINDGHDPQLVSTFFDVMSRFTVKDSWTGEVREIASSGGILDNGFGRLMRCDPQWAYTVAPALMGQGGARDITCEVLLRLMRRHPDYAQYLRTWVHDEFVFSVPEDRAEEIGADVKEAFTWSWKDVPILADLSKPGSSWGAISAK